MISASWRGSGPLPLHDALETTMTNHSLNPDITLGEQEQRRLTILAMAGTGHTADAADDLLYEMQRAQVVPDADLPPSIIRMGSRVKYRTDDGVERRVTLVYPAEAEPARGHISVLTAAGTALVGLREGQSIAWMTPEGRKEALTVLAVHAPEAVAVNR
jgi:regulator of nucleoside diphosphate kinase